jgi:RNA polymerase subunit RPABC4/transcription elongation factor Spt4
VTAKMRCAAVTKDKKRCKRFTDGKGKFCSVHKKKK